MKSWMALLKRAAALLLASSGMVMLLSTLKSKKLFLPSFPRVPPIVDLLGHHGAEGTQKPRWGDIASQAEEAEEDRNFDDLPDFVESPTAEEEALQDVVDTQKSLNNLGGVMETTYDVEPT